MDRVVIVGGGLAGHRAVQALQKDFEGDVTLISDEEHRPYDRPPLSKQVLTGDREPDDTGFKCDGLEVEWKLSSAAESLDTSAKVVRLAGGDEVGYDGLVIATGRRARAWPDLPDLEGFFMLRSLDDARALRKAIGDASKVAIVGAGFIGCEVAASLRANGLDDVTVIEMADLPLPPVGKEAGAFAQRIHEDEGVAFKLGASVEGFDGADGRVRAVCLDGGEVEADLVLLALGSAPNTEWLEDSGIELCKGNVVCDEHLFVAGAQDVVAAGDVAAWPHPHVADEHGLASIEHWTTSRELAKTAALNLVARDDGDRSRFLTVPTFWSDQYGVKIKSAGLLQAADEFDVVEEDAEKRRLVVEAKRDGELIGVVVFNKNKAFADYQRQLKDQLSQ